MLCLFAYRLRAGHVGQIAPNLPFSCICFYIWFNVVATHGLLKSNGGDVSVHTLILIYTCNIEYNSQLISNGRVIAIIRHISAYIFVMMKPTRDTNAANVITNSHPEEMKQSTEEARVEKSENRPAVLSCPRKKKEMQECNSATKGSSSPPPSLSFPSSVHSLKMEHSFTPSHLHTSSFSSSSSFIDSASFRCCNWLFHSQNSSAFAPQTSVPLYSPT